MTAANSLRLTISGVVLSLLLPLAGCGDHAGPTERHDLPAPATTKATGGVTSASPGGANVGPEEGTGAGVR